MLPTFRLGWMNGKPGKLYNNCIPSINPDMILMGRQEVYVVEFGRCKVLEALRSYKDGPDKAFDLFIKYLDQIVYYIYRDGMANTAQGVVLIVDDDGFSIANHASPLGVKAALRQLAVLDRVSKVLNYAFVGNVNLIADNVMRLARPLFGNILDKCEIFGPQK